jgi:putative SOS response-associated peptidase YedK
MCGRVIQSSGPLRYAIVDGMNVRDSRVHNYPPRWNAAPSQDLLVIRRNHKTGEVLLDPLRWGLVPYWCEDPKGGRKPINAKGDHVPRVRRQRLLHDCERLAISTATIPIRKMPSHVCSQRIPNGWITVACPLWMQLKT